MFSLFFGLLTLSIHVGEVSIVQLGKSFAIVNGIAHDNHRGEREFVVTHNAH